MFCSIIHRYRNLRMHPAHSTFHMIDHASWIMVKQVGDSTSPGGGGKVNAGRCCIRPLMSRHAYIAAAHFWSFWYLSRYSLLMMPFFIIGSPGRRA